MIKKNTSHLKDIQKISHTEGFSSVVSSVYRFVVHIENLRSAQPNAIVQFSNGEMAIIWQANEKATTALLLSANSKVEVGMGAKLVADNFSVYASDKLLGRIVDPLLSPKDGKSIDKKGTPQPVFGSAPGFYERAIVDEQLGTGVVMVDTLFPIVKGQRIAIIGDNKSGKTTFLSQVAQYQSKEDTVLVYVLIAKHKNDINKLLERLKVAGVLEKTIIVVADIFDALPLSYLAPYVGCAIAESFWRAGKNTVVFYDDLTAHAKLYREMSLLLDVPPGREGYPGDMFWQHSSLLERAGKLKRNGASQTVLAVGTTPTGDLTGYLPTSLISMTDGQIVFDLSTMHRGVKPAVNVGVSVSRVGGRSQSKQFAELASRVRAELAKYRTASDFARFGTELSDVATKQIALGDKLYELFKQPPEYSYSLKEQYIMLEALMQSKEPEEVSISWLKSVIQDVTLQDIDEKDYIKIAKELIKSNPMVKTP
ncbi:sodium-transporting two-sector ATPase [Candidatus Saccharibacteria bacterium]|nr:sodium-transporting two-sector ATPase [Candidatus Saccharibacteria bacterium]